MTLSDHRIDQIVTAFAESGTDILPDLAQDLSAVSATKNYDSAVKIINLYNARKEQADNDLSAMGDRG